MFDNIHLAGHVTGSIEVVDIGFFTERVKRRPRYTVGQMFFKPYESGKEFAFCLRHTLEPLLLLVLSVLDPLTLLVIPAIFLGLAACSLFVAFIGWCINSDSVKSFGLTFANGLMTQLVQVIIDTLVSPIAIVTLVTRSISTGLKAAGIYDYSAPPEALADEVLTPSLG